MIYHTKEKIDKHHEELVNLKSETLLLLEGTRVTKEITTKF